MQQELRNAQFQAAEASLAAFACYNKASRTVWKDSQTAQLWSRWGDMMMAINKKANDEAAFLEWAIAVDEAHNDGYWQE